MLSLPQQLTQFAWHVAFVYLLVLFFLSFIIYRNTRDRIFFNYTAYVGLLITYILCRNYYFPDFLKEYRWAYLYSYLVQVLYLCIYFHFGMMLLNFKHHYPRFTSWIYRYLILMIGMGVIVFMLAAMDWVPDRYMASYYVRIFFPVHILVALMILYRAFLLRQEEQRFYFLTGSVFYLVFGTFALLKSSYPYFKDINIGLLEPMGYFFVGVILECTFFAIGLGIRVKNLYQGKLEVEQQLNIALQKEKDMQTLAAKVALLENKVLRSQMNSHFIFNVLNAIKAYIVERDVDNSVKYLSKFSQLMRKILDKSMDERGNLADELDTVELYLAVEKMRMSEELSIDWTVTTERDLSLVPFPSLLLQPLVENAIWHGLLPITGKKKLQIIVQIIPGSAPSGSEPIHELWIEVLDNGLGYTQSLSAPREASKHRSYGIEIIRERIARFNTLQPTYEMCFGINDRYPASGTRVWIRMLL